MAKQLQENAYTTDKYKFNGKDEISGKALTEVQTLIDRVSTTFQVIDTCQEIINPMHCVRVLTKLLEQGKDTKTIEQITGYNSNTISVKRCKMKKANLI